MTVLWKENKEKTIILSQHGRYIEFNKRGSPLVYKYDMGSSEFFCEEKRTGDRKHINDSRATNTWFNAKLVTDDNKIASMFIFAKSLAGGNPGIKGIMAKFNDRQVRDIEQWAALGTRFRTSGTAWGNRRSGTHIQVRPSDVDREIRDFIAEKTWSIAELNNFCHVFDNFEDTHIINQIFKEITEHPEYSSAFIVVQNGHATNYLYEPTVLDELSDLVEIYNLQVPRLLYYINYLNGVERVSVHDLLLKYRSYLETELENQEGRRNRMYKFPIHFYSVYHTQQEIIRREAELENYVPDDHVYENAYLEYSDDEYMIIIPRSPEDVQDEGNQQGHCVAERFMDMIAAGDTCVVFMRRSDRPNHSLITIEIRNNCIRQACIYNNDPVPDEYRPWIRSWAAMKGVQINSSSWSTMLDV